jgi:hypothetical protein
MAERWVLGRPVALNLDIDVVRGLLGADATPDGGRAALKLAVAMASTHLTEGYDVIVPQFLARQSFITELEALARAVRARFVEIALIASREETLRAFALRSVEPENQQHRDAHASLERLGGMRSLGEMHDEFMQLLDTRPSAYRIDVVGAMSRRHSGSSNRSSRAFSDVSFKSRSPDRELTVQPTDRRQLWRG